MTPACALSVALALIFRSPLSETPTWGAASIVTGTGTYPIQSQKWASSTPSKSFSQPVPSGTNRLTPAEPVNLKMTLASCSVPPDTWAEASRLADALSGKLMLGGEDSEEPHSPKIPEGKLKLKEGPSSETRANGPAFDGALLTVPGAIGIDSFRLRFGNASPIEAPVNDTRRLPPLALTAVTLSNIPSGSCGEGSYQMICPTLTFESAGNTMALGSLGSPTT